MCCKNDILHHHHNSRVVLERIFYDVSMCYVQCSTKVSWRLERGKYFCSYRSRDFLFGPVYLYRSSWCKNTLVKNNFARTYREKGICPFRGVNLLFCPLEHCRIYWWPVSNTNYNTFLRGHPGVWKHYKAARAILTIKLYHIGQNQPLTHGTVG